MLPNYSEADTRSKLIDPALRERGWLEPYIRREVNAGGLYKIGSRWRRENKFADYVLRFPVADHAEPVAVALIEAKRNTLPADHGLEQAKQYADARRLNVPFVYSSNGYRFVEFDAATGQTSPARLMSEFPTPEELCQRYEAYKGFSLDDEKAKPLLSPYTGGNSVRRYYQDAAIRAVMEKIAQGGNRMLLSLATGSGKTRIAVHLLKRIADAGQLSRVLFVCDRAELRDQALLAFQNVFGNDAQPVSTANPCKNARILIATYQTLDVDTDDAEANFFLKHYPANYFSHVVIDECHRSAWGKWSIVLTHNPDAVQIGLTATPRQFKFKTATPEAQADARITADNLAYFGEPVYEYSLGQGIKDGYLAACEVVKSTINLDDTGITLEEILARNSVDALTGQPITEAYLRKLYEKLSYENQILLPDRVLAMCRDLFDHLLETGGPEQKTIIFCVRDHHAAQVAAQMNNLYSDWCAAQGCTPKEHYAFKCTAASSGNDMLPDFRASGQSYFVATTVDLLTTGVDVKPVRNVAFFRYVRSPIAFHQMVGRGTRIYEPDNKLSFRVYDYTNATDLFGQEFITPPASTQKPAGEGPEPSPEPVIEVRGFDVRITDAGRYILADVDGAAVPITVEEYKAQIAARLVERAPYLPDFRRQWIDPDARKALMLHLPANGQSALLIRDLERMDAYDLYDVLAELGYGLAPRTRRDRVDAFFVEQAGWLAAMEARSAYVIRTLAAQFAEGGTEQLETQYLWRVSAVRQAGGLRALRDLGRPADVLRETKARMFAA